MTMKSFQEMTSHYVVAISLGILAVVALNPDPLGASSLQVGFVAPRHNDLRHASRLGVQVQPFDRGVLSIPGPVAPEVSDLTAAIPARVRIRSVFEAHPILNPVTKCERGYLDEPVSPDAQVRLIPHVYVTSYAPPTVSDHQAAAVRQHVFPGRPLIDSVIPSQHQVGPRDSPSPVSESADTQAHHGNTQCPPCRIHEPHDSESRNGDAA